MNKKRKIPDPLFHEMFPPQPRKGDLKKYEIIQAAISIAAEKSVLNLNFESIADSIHVRRSHIQYYFSSLEDLMTSMIEYIAKHGQKWIIEALEKQGDPKKLLNEYIEANFSWIFKNPELSTAMILIYHVAAANIKLSASIAQLQIAAQNRLCGMIASSSHSKINQKRLEEISRTLYSAIIGEAICLLSTRANEKAFIEAMKRVKDLASRLLAHNN